MVLEADRRFHQVQWERRRANERRAEKRRREQAAARQAAAKRENEECERKLIENKRKEAAAFNAHYVAGALAAAEAIEAEANAAGARELAPAAQGVLAAIEAVRDRLDAVDVCEHPVILPWNHERSGSSDVHALRTWLDGLFNLENGGRPCEPPFLRTEVAFAGKEQWDAEQERLRTRTDVPRSRAASQLRKKAHAAVSTLGGLLQQECPSAVRSALDEDELRCRVAYGKSLREWLALHEEARPRMPLRESNQPRCGWREAFWHSARLDEAYKASMKVWWRERCDPRGFV